MSDLIYTGEARPHYFLPGNVLDAAMNRVRWIFDEFDGHVSVSTSGGKDSTVVLELACAVAAERGIPFIKAHFLDQEAEYEATIDYMRTVRDRPDVKLDWYQVPFRLFNATSFGEQWSNVWDVELDDSTWIRPKEPDSIHVNSFVDFRGRMIDRFKPLLKAMNTRDGGAILTGMRCEESPTRRIFMTSKASYKWATWCSGGKGSYLFHPIYDWSYRDVWKAIYDHDWTYNTFYDYMFRYGVPLRGMRVSSFHHEQSYLALEYLQEVEPQTWERATQRLKGINAYGHIGEEITPYYYSHLPYMFTTWSEYLEYLIDNLIQDEGDRVKFRKMRTNAERTLPYVPQQEIVRTVLALVMLNDVYGSNMDQWVVNQKSREREWRAWAEQHPEWSIEKEVGRAS